MATAIYAQASEMLYTSSADRKLIWESGAGPETLPSPCRNCQPPRDVERYECGARVLTSVQLLGK